MTDFSLNYGKAIYDLSCEEKLSDVILGDFNLVSELLSDNPEYSKLLDTPTISKEEKCKLLDEVFKNNVHEYSLNFLKILSEKKSVYRFEKCKNVFVKSYNKDNNIEIVIAVTAKPLNEELEAKLVSKLHNMTGKNIVLKNDVDPSCLGGMIIRFENSQIDGSLKTKLENLKKQIFA